MRNKETRKGLKMVVKEEGKKVRVTFDSITDYVSYLRRTKETEKYRGKNRQSHRTDERGRIFTGTESYEEAEDLFLNGWDEGTKQLAKKMNEVKNKIVEYKNKPCYSVAGYQACVPRYLQGIPDSMIYTKKIKQKQKVIDIVKDIGYNCATKKEEIMEESVKVLRLVERLEKQGYRVNLYVAIVFDGQYRSEYSRITTSIKVKSSAQRLNLKQVAFPLVHPSMLRRIFFSFIEKCPYTYDYTQTYGRCTSDYTFRKSFVKQYCIPRIVEEKEIIDIEKYYSE